MLRSFPFYGFLLLSTFFFSTPLYADGFDILGIPRTANMDEARKAYRALVKEYHPDRNHSPGAEEKLKAINNAYDDVSRILSSSRASSHDNTDDFSSSFTQAANNGYTNNNSSADMAAVINQLMAVLRRESQNLPTKPLSTLQNVFFNSSSAGDINAFVAFLRQNQINPQNYSKADLLKLVPFYENKYLLFFQLGLETFWMKYSGAKDCFHPACRDIYSTFLYSKSIGSALGRSVGLQMGKLNSLIMGFENDSRPMNRREKIALDKQLLKTYFLNALRACDEKLGADCLIDFLGEISWFSGTFANVLEKETAEKLSEATVRALASPQATYHLKGKMERIAQNLTHVPSAPSSSFDSSFVMRMCSQMFRWKK